MGGGSLYATGPPKQASHRDAGSGTFHPSISMAGEERVMERQDGNIVQDGLLCIINAKGKTLNAILLGCEAR